MRPVNARLKLLIVEDSEDDLLLMVREIKHGGYQVAYKRVESEAEMRAALAGEDWDLIVADYTMPHFSGLAALEVLRSTGLDIPLIIVSGTITDETAVSAMRSGAKDYLMKGNLRRLVPVIEREISERHERSERRRAEESLKQREEEELRLKQESEAATKRFLRDTVYAVTDGRLNLVSYEEAERLSPPTDLMIELDSGEKIGAVRAAVTDAAHSMHMPDDRIHALVTAIGEATANALKHAGGGVVSIHCMGDKIRVGIRDHGEGIESLILPKATLMTRFSTKRSMGFGYAVMLASVDAVYLATGRQGTWLILEQGVKAVNPEFSLVQLPDIW
jgi:CheY-like chemotaxis protein